MQIKKIRLELDCQYKKYASRFEPYREFIATHKINDENKDISKMSMEEIFSKPVDKFKPEAFTQNLQNKQENKPQNKIGLEGNK